MTVRTAARQARARGPRVGTVPRRRPRLTGRAAGLLAIVLVLSMSLVFPIRQFAAERAKVQKLEQRIDALTRSNAVLEGRVRQFQDPEYLERLARECLGMVKPGEISFVTVPKDGAAPPVPSNPDC